jgi:hypothetical protein
MTRIAALLSLILLAWLVTRRRPTPYTPEDRAALETAIEGWDGWGIGV